MEPRLSLNLDELLKRNKLRASDLSKKTGIPKQTLSEWRSGLVPKSVLSLKKVATAFGVSLDELVFEYHQLVDQSNNTTENWPSPLPPQKLEHTPQAKGLSPQAQALAPQTADLQPQATAYIMTCDRQGMLHSVSPWWMQQLGWKSLQHRSIFELMCLKDLSTSCAATVREALEVPFHSVEARLLLHNLQIETCSWINVPMPNEGLSLCIVQPQPEQDASIDEVQSFEAAGWVQLIAQLLKAQAWTAGVSLNLEGPSNPIVNRRHSLTRLVLVSFNNMACAMQPETLEARIFQEGEYLHLKISGVAALSETEATELLSLPLQLLPAVGAQADLKRSDSQWQLTLTVPLKLSQH